jgi:hypothetical protein
VAGAVEGVDVTAVGTGAPAAIDTANGADARVRAVASPPTAAAVCWPPAAAQETLRHY